MNALELIKDYVNRHAENPIEDLTLETRLDSLGLDSLAMLELLFEVEDKYDISLPDNTAKPETVGALIVMIEQHLPKVVS